MNVNQKVIVVIGCLGVMISAGGCANKEVVKKDEPMAGSTSPVKSAAAPTTGTKAIPGMTAPVVQAAPSAATQQPVKSTVSQASFEKIYFDFDSSDLSKSSRDTLTRSAEILLKDQKQSKLSIEGNCDERGSAEYNLALGERRAKAAAKYLTTLGVQPERLSVVSYGNEKPALQGSDEAAWAKNRRDEFVVTK
jgi:peptidoglycan-associated lipoprotein